MSNKKNVSIFGVFKKAFHITSACLVLRASVGLSQFGIAHIPIDLGESNMSDRNRAERHIFAKHCEQWSNQFGYRVICRKEIANDYFKFEYTDVNDLNARRVVEDVLIISPFEPAYYVLRAKVGLYALDPVVQIVGFLRLAYLTGRPDQYVMLQRFNLIFAVWDELETVDKIIALNDFIKNTSSDQEAIYQLILTAPKSTRDDMIGLLEKRAPELFDRFTRDLAEK